MKSSPGLLAMPDDALQLIFDALAEGSWVLSRDSEGIPLSQTCRRLCDFYRLKYVSGFDACSEKGTLRATEETVFAVSRLLQRYPLVTYVSISAALWQQLTSADVKSHNVDLARVTELYLVQSPAEGSGELEVAGEGVGDDTLLLLCRFVPALRGLNVSLSNSASVSGLSAISSLASLESLMLAGRGKDGTCLVTAVSAVLSLRRLMLVNCIINAELLSRLPSGLNYLEVSYCVTGPDEQLIDLDSLLRFIHSLSGLRGLCIRRVSSLWTDWSQLSEFAAGLTMLKLYACGDLSAGRIDGRNLFATFSSMHSLTSLSLKFSECLYDDVLRVAANLPNLVVLSLSSLIGVGIFGGVVCTERVISHGGLVALSKRPARHSLRQALFTFFCQDVRQEVMDELILVLETSRNEIFGPEVVAKGVEINFRVSCDHYRLIMNA